MKVVVEWMDGQKREYPGMESANSKDGVLRIWKSPYYGKTEMAAEVPLYNVREWKPQES
jgi:hypothetical protein